MLRQSMGLLVLFGIALSFSAPAVAQAQQTRTEEVQIMAELYQAQKKAVISRAMALTAEESAAFWPVYNEFSAELNALNVELGVVIKDFAANFQVMSESKAKELRDNWFRLEQARLDLLKRYADHFATILPQVKATRLVQTLNRINLRERIQIAEQIPLIR